MSAENSQAEVKSDAVTTVSPLEQAAKGPRSDAPAPIKPPTQGAGAAPDPKAALAMLSKLMGGGKDKLKEALEPCYQRIRFIDAELQRLHETIRHKIAHHSDHRTDQEQLAEYQQAHQEAIQDIAEVVNQHQENAAKQP